MDQEMIKVKYKLCELEQILLEIETVVQDAIQRDNIKTDNDNLNFLLYTLGKSIVTIREIIILCWAGYPDGALSLSRNIFEQFIHVAYIEGHEKSKELDLLLEKYNADYNYQRLKNLKWEAKYITQNTEKEEEYRKKIQAIKQKYKVKGEIRDYWWAKLKSFSNMCDKVVQQSEDFRIWIRNMQLIYRRACSTLHSSCMGNKIRLGSDFAGIDVGPWNKGQEVSLFLASSGLLLIVTIIYKVLNEDYKDIQSKIGILVNYYWDCFNKKKDCDQV